MLVLAVLACVSFAASPGPDATGAARAAISYALEHGPVKAATAQRRVVIAHEATTDALRSAFPADSVRFDGLVPGRSATKGAFSEIAVRVEGRVSRWRLPEDLVFVSITAADRRSDSSVIVRVDVAYSVGEREIHGLSMNLLVELVSGNWKVTKFISGAVG